MIINDSYCWAAKRSLIDNVMMDTYGVSDKIGISEWIESLDDSTIKVLSECIVNTVDESEHKKILESWYSRMANKGSGVLHESTWMDGRNSVLVEADGNQNPVIDFKQVLKYGGIPALAAYYVRLRAFHPDEADQALNNFKRDYASLYNTLMSEIKKSFPTFKVTQKIPLVSGEHTKILDELKNKYAELIAELKMPKPDMETVKTLQDDIKNLDSNLTSEKQIWNSLKKKISSAATKTGKLALIGAGATAVGIFLWKLYQKLTDPARKACKGKKGNDQTACILKYKIIACDVVIKKYQDLLGACDKNKNPEKCAHIYKTQIWQWTAKKKSHEKKLASLSTKGETGVASKKAKTTPGASSIFRLKA